MTYTSADDRLGLRYDMPSVALAPLAWYLGVHMLKCLQEAGKTTISTSSGPSTAPIPTEHKTTQIDIYSKKVKEKVTHEERKAPTKTGRRQIDESKKHRPRKSESDIRFDSKTTKSESVHREVRNKKIEREGSTKHKSEDRPTGNRRFSTGSCPKRTSEAHTEQFSTEWVLNPAFTGDNGDRTDRSEMSLPWQDMSLAMADKSHDPSMPRLAVKSFAENVQRHVPARVRPTQPTMEPVHEASRSLNLRPQSEKRMPTPTDLLVQEVVQRKIGRPLAEMDTASLKSISRERVKQLAEKYARGDRPGGHPGDHVPASYLAQQALRARDSADSMYVRVDPQRGRVVV